MIEYSNNCEVNVPINSIIKYGVHNNYIDVTELALNNFVSADRIIIPSGDHARAAIFSDPLPYVLKSIFVINNIDNMYSEKVQLILKKYNISPNYSSQLICDATGIGDILIRILCIKNGLILPPFNINLSYFTRLYYSSDPINQLEFRINLIYDLLKDNDMPNNTVKFVYSKNNEINSTFPYEYIRNFKLELNCNNEKIINEEYIIFHTKCRFTSNINYDFLKHNISIFCSNFKTKYKIVIMGEQIFPTNEEVLYHGITTIYNELLGLKNNNDVLDISIKNIYNNLDYDNYKNDINLIKNAKINILVGSGGQFCTCLLFGKGLINYKTKELMDICPLNLEEMEKINCHVTTDILNFFEKIRLFFQKE